MKCIILLCGLFAMIAAAYNNGKAWQQEECPIEGQVFQECRCPATCEDPVVICPLVCEPGCDCPFGQVIDEINNKCVDCSTSECPIEGQVFQECRTCPATCEDPHLICPRVCQPGCGCPPGQVIDEINNRCVDLDDCSIQCPIEGQVFQECRTCPATCEDPHLICPRVCQPGCGCPPGQVIDEINNRCVDPKQCLAICPDGQEPAICFVDPCQFASCPAFPTAVCEADYCGGCYARFFLPSGNEVTDLCYGY